MALGLDGGVWLGLLTIAVLLTFSGLISGAEVAFFSLSRKEIDSLAEDNGDRGKSVAQLLEQPRRLLATLLIANNFVNVAVVILSAYLAVRYIPAEALNYQLLGIVPIGWALQALGVTVSLLLFGEIMPKVYASQHPTKVALTMAYPMRGLVFLTKPLGSPLLAMSKFIDARLKPSESSLTVDELTHALELASDENSKNRDDQRLLEGIVQFGQTPVRSIMCPRLEMEGLDVSDSFSDTLRKVQKAGYSRYPVFAENLDKVVGFVHIKDLLAHIDQGDDFDWNSKLRPPFFIPEGKMIDDLLEEFRTKKMHMAVVVDEYGGTSGLVTLEDILEEIVGEISDEFDSEELVFTPINDHTFVFEGKTPLKQFYRATNLDFDTFSDFKGEADTLAGLILEVNGRIPQKGEAIDIGPHKFVIESVDRRRIGLVKVIISTDSKDEPPSFSMLLSMAAATTLLFSGCEPDYVPKPRGMMHIDLPNPTYVAAQTEQCPFRFELSGHAAIIRETRHADQPCWFNIEYPSFKAKIHISYSPVQGNLPKLLDDMHALTSKHLSKATGISEHLIDLPLQDTYGMRFDIAGASAASPIQFYLTDSTHHFLRAALYFNAVPNNDSLAPVIQFISGDIDHLIRTFSWK